MSRAPAAPWAARSVLIAVALTALVAVSAVPAAAATTSRAAHRAAVRRALMRAVKRHPGVVRKAWFIHRASLVDFILPVTIRLRTGDNPGTPADEAATLNPNTANVDLGASLGNRVVNLGGHLNGQIRFHDSYDGGALGAVDITLLPGGDLSTTSVPLLWNDQVATAPATHWFDNGQAGAGCSDFTNANTVPSIGTTTSTVGRTLDTPLSGSGYHGRPYFATQADADAYDAGGSPALIAGTTEVFPGADDVSLLSASKSPTDLNAIGANPDPFPVAAGTRPGAFPAVPNAQDTVLRTAPLHLAIAPPGTPVTQAGPAAQQDGNGPQDSQNQVIGKSGGQANLFGDIPGRDTQIFITANFATKITSILRIVDPDRAEPVTGAPYPASTLSCRQYWSGTVQNYLYDITLVGSLHISPAITSDGKLRIARASLASDDPWDVALAACLTPYSTVSQTSGVPLVPSDQFTGQSATGPSATNPQPTGVKCNAPPSPFVAASGIGPLQQNLLDPTTDGDGSQVSVAASITVPQIEADVLIGDAGGG